MSKNKSDKKFDELKNYYKEVAKEKEKQLHMDVLAVRHAYVPHYLKRKFLTGCAIFGSVYLLEHLLFGKKVPFVVKSTGAAAAVVMAPKVYQKLHNKVMGIGEMKPMEMEMLEDQQLSDGLEDDRIIMEEDESIVYPVEKAPVVYNEDVNNRTADTNPTLPVVDETSRQPVDEDEANIKPATDGSEDQLKGTQPT